MNNSYLSSILNALLLSKLSTTIRLFVIVLFVGLFASNTVATAQITQRGAATTATAATTNNTTITINKPSGVVAGDVLLFSVVQNETDNDNGGLSSPTLSGWTLVKDILIRSDGTGNGNNAWFGSIYYRVSDGSEGTSFSFEMHSQCDMAIGSMVAFTGVACNALKPDGSAGGPFDIQPGSFRNRDSDTAEATGVTVATNNSAVVMFAMCNNNETYSDWSNSQTELFDYNTAQGDDASVGAAWLSSVDSGSTGTGEVTLSDKERNSAIFLVLRRATTMSAGAASATRTLCQNTALSTITHTTVGATGISNSGVSGENGLPAGVSASWASNTITISGTPTVSGTFTYSIPLIGSCAPVNATGTITVTPAKTAGTASSTPTLCINTALTNITRTTTGATGIGTATGLPAGVTATWASNTITISGTPTASGTFNYSIPLTGGCGSVNATGTITVTPAKTAGIASSTPTLCINTALTNITRTTTGATGIGTATGLPAGVTAAWASNTITISGTPTSSGTFNYSIPLTGGCGSVNATGTITVSPASVGGTIAGSATVCTGTNSTVLTLSGHTGTITRWQSSTSSTFASAVTNITNTTTTLTASNLTATTYYRAVLTSGSCVSNSAIASVTVSPASVGGTATANVSAVCIGSGSSIALAGYTGTIQWQQSANGTSGWADVTTGSGGTSATYITPNLATTTYYRASVTSGDCTLANSTVVEVTVKPLPIATITANYCAVAGKIQLTASGGDTYLWNTGETSNPILVDLAGNYSVTASVGGCTSTPFFLYVGQELVTNGDFTAGNTGFTSGYTYKEDIAGNNRELWDDKGNAVGTNGQNYHENFWGIDHTNNSTGPKNFMLVNGSGSTITIWEQTVNVQPNTDYYFSAWAMSLNNVGPYAKLRFEVNGVQVGTTANLGAGPSNATDALDNDYWTRFYSDPVWNSGSLNGPITIKIVNLESSASGNDFALDDISFGTLAALPFSIVAAGNTGTDSTLCTGETFNLFTNLTNGKDPIRYSWTGPNGFTSTLANPSISNVTTANSGNYTLTVTDGYNCGSQTKSVNLTVTPVLISPTIGITTQPTCTKATGSVVLNGLPSSVTWNLYQNGNATPLVTGGSGTSTTISDLAVGDYTFTVSIGACISSASSSISINPLVTNTWNGSQWSTLANPTIDQNIIFESNYTSSSDLAGCTCQVKSGAKVIISPSNTLTIYNQVAVLGSGTLTFESSSSDVNSKPISNSGSLVQKNNTPPVANSGDIIYKRIVPAIHNTDYTYWSSPVSSQTLKGFSPQSQNNYYSFDADSDSWARKNSSENMDKGNGYCIYGPINNTQNNTIFNGTFQGTPNNGLVEITGVKINQNYLIGNPYPSAIDADLFILANSGVIDGALYFWTHNTDPVNGQYIYDDYATYNLTGGTGTKASKGRASTSENNNAYFNANIPNGFIAAGQGFFIGSNETTISNTKIVFDNNMRVGNGNGIVGLNSNFFKTKGNTKVKNGSAIQKDRVWLNLSNDQGVFKQTLVGYITGATNDCETIYDADSYDSLDAADFYSINQDKNLVIQGRALPFDENDEVPLGYRTTINGEFTIKIDQTDGLLASQSIFIEDKLTNTVFDLKSGNYIFSTTAGTFDDRFVLRYTNKTLSVDETDKEDGILVLYSNNYETLIIHNNDMYSTVNSVALFNITGQNIANWEVNDSEQTNIQIPIKNTSSGIYIVKVKTTKGESNKKIIIK